MDSLLHDLSSIQRHMDENSSKCKKDKGNKSGKYQAENTTHFSRGPTVRCMLQHFRVCHHDADYEDDHDADYTDDHGADYIDDHDADYTDDHDADYQ